MAGYRVRYTLATKLVNELVEAADDKQLTKTINRYGRVDLLCIDELGYMELDRRGAELLFQVLTERRKRRVSRSRPTSRSAAGPRPSPTPASAPPSSTASPSAATSSRPAPTPTASPRPAPPSRTNPGTAMPWTRLDTADAIELAETLQLIARWLTADPERLAAIAARLHRPPRLRARCPPRRPGPLRLPPRRQRRRAPLRARRVTGRPAHVAAAHSTCDPMTATTSRRASSSKEPAAGDAARRVQARRGMPDHGQRGWRRGHRRHGEDDSHVYVIAIREADAPGCWSLLFMEPYDADDPQEIQLGTDTYCLV